MSLSFRRVVAGLAVLSMLVLSACSRSSTPDGSGGGSGGGQSATGPIKIGFVGGLTGPLAEYTTAGKEVIDWAVAEINAKGGILGRQVEVIYADTKMDPQLARQAVERMTKSDKVVGIVGDYYSPNTLALHKLVDLAKVPLVTPNSADPAITTQGSGFVFRTVHTATVETEVAASYVVETMGKKRVVVFGGTDGFSKSNSDAMVNWLKTTGKGELIGNETYDRATTKDFTNLLVKYKDKQVDAIFLAGGMADGALITKQARDAGMTATVFGATAQARPGFYGIGGPSTVGSILLTDYPGDAVNWEQHADPATKEFINKFRAKFNKQPGYDHVHTYDALMMILDAIKAANSTDGTAIRDQIAKASPFKGAAGDRRLLANGDSRAKLYLLRVEEGGKFNIIHVVPDDGK